MITHVAIRFHGTIYSLPKPNRHHHVLWHIIAVTGAHYIDENEQGFLDDKGVFYTREEAYLHAYLNGQILNPKRARYDMLFSEDVW